MTKIFSASSFLLVGIFSGILILDSPASKAQQGQVVPIPRTMCTLKFGRGTNNKIRFPCSVSPFGYSVKITDLNSGKAYGDNWAMGRNCIYQEGAAEICTDKEWAIK